MSRTPWNEETRELIVNARDALRELLQRVKVQDCIALRAEYGVLAGWIEQDDKDREREPRYSADSAERPGSSRDHITAAKDALAVNWTKVPVECRERHILDALGDGALTVSELAERINAKFRTDECGIYDVIDDGNIRPTLERMRATGQLKRVAKTYDGARKRFHYSRQSEVTGAIADLERAFREGADR